MKVHLYTMAWNEAGMVGFFFRHYDPCIDHYVVYDDGSTDGTTRLLAAHPRVELRRFERNVSDSFVESQRHLYNRVWKESRDQADWVVITALDEHLHLPGQELRSYLRQCQLERVTYLPALGYQMVAEESPGPEELLCEKCTWGAPFAEMNKLSVFDPNAIEETGFQNGRHAAAPVGRLRLPERDELLLLHYKYIGFQRTYERQRFLHNGLGAKDIANGWGHRYLWSADQLKVEWDNFARRAVNISCPDLRPWESHRLERWWRPKATSPDAGPSNLTAGDEAWGLVVDGLYRQFFGRDPDPVGRMNWIVALAGGATVESAILEFATSVEYMGRFASEPAFVLSLFQRLWNRPGNTAEATPWIRLSQTNGRAAVVHGFLSSREYRGPGSFISSASTVPESVVSIPSCRAATQSTRTGPGPENE